MLWCGRRDATGDVKADGRPGGGDVKELATGIQSSLEPRKGRRAHQKAAIIKKRANIQVLVALR